MSERPVIEFAPLPARVPVAAPVKREVVRPVIRFGVPEEPGSPAEPEPEVDLWRLVRTGSGYGRMRVLGCGEES